MEVLKVFMERAENSIKETIRETIEKEIKLGPTYYSMAKYSAELIPYLNYQNQTNRCQNALNRTLL